MQLTESMQNKFRKKREKVTRDPNILRCQLLMNALKCVSRSRQSYENYHSTVSGIKQTQVQKG